MLNLAFLREKCGGTGVGSSRDYDVILCVDSCFAENSAIKLMGSWMCYNGGMKVVEVEIGREELLGAENVFEGPMVKAVVDIERGMLAIDADLHADLEQLLLEDGSRQEGLWGINLYPEDEGEDLVEFDSMINVRPRQGNPSRGVDDPEKQAKIREIVAKWVK